MGLKTHSPREIVRSLSGLERVKIEGDVAGAANTGV